MEKKQTHCIFSFFLIAPVVPDECKEIRLFDYNCEFASYCTLKWPRGSECCVVVLSNFSELLEFFQLHQPHFERIVGLISLSTYRNSVCLFTYNSASTIRFILWEGGINGDAEKLRCEDTHRQSSHRQSHIIAFFSASSFQRKAYRLHDVPFFLLLFCFVRSFFSRVQLNIVWFGCYCFRFVIFTACFHRPPHI